MENNETEQAKPTLEMAESMQEIIELLNIALFDGKLEPCFVTLTRNNRVNGGYHSAKQWSNEDGQEVAEIGINSNMIAEGDPTTFYNVLIHELIHHELTCLGTHGRVGYHNQVFADRCHELDLTIHVNDKDKKRGQETGQSVYTEMTPGGISEKVVANIPIDLAYYTSTVIDIDDNGQPKAVQGQKAGERPKQPKTKAKTAGKRTKYTCPMCGLSMWGKAGAYLICGECQKDMIAAQ